MTVPFERALVPVPQPKKRELREVFEYIGIIFDPNESVSEYGGRPLSISMDKIRKLEEAFSYDASPKEACFYAGVGVSTYYEWLNRWPKLAERFEEVRQHPVLLARQTIVNNLKNPATAAWYLERKAKKEFKPTVQIDSEDEVRGIIIEHIYVEANQNEPHGTNGENNADAKQDGEVAAIPLPAETEQRVEVPRRFNND